MACLSVYRLIHKTMDTIIHRQMFLVYIVWYNCLQLYFPLFIY